jgi:DNA mismatch repair protein MutL
VVERPASVVKELVENSLDAGAKRVDVKIEAGGRGLIRVADVGEGMSREDLRMSVERHATSKVRSEEDLEAITTLGFRGEALPSIGSVSLLRMTSATDDSGGGWRLEVTGGEVAEPVAAASLRGTVAEVRNLFFNTPARRKFLRSVEREAAVIRETVHALALAHPGRAFSLTSEGRVLLACEAASGRAERVAQLSDAGLEFLQASREAGGVRVEAYVSGQDRTRPTRAHQRYLVNQRPVRDKTLAHAVAAATAPVFPPGRHPDLVLYLDVDPGLVDVNAHPAKTEVRFRRSGDLHSAVTATLAAALHAPTLGSPRFGSAPRGGAGPAFFQVADGPVRSGERGRSDGAFADSSAGFGGATGGAAVSTVRADGGPAAALEPVLRPGTGLLAQYRDSYLLTADAEGLVLVDQHAAHERILFEKILDGLRAGAPAVQPLLHPAVVELPAALLAGLAARAAELSELGIEVEPFGDSAALVRALPADLGPLDPAAFLRDVLTDLERDREVVEDDAAQSGAPRFVDDSPAESRRRRAAASAACQSAIKVNFPLTAAKMTWLLSALAECRVPTTCPHGRPIRLRIGHEAIEKAFLRL